MGTRSVSVRPNFLKASKYKMSLELIVSTIILLTWAFAIRAEITKASLSSGYSLFPDLKVISGSQLCLSPFSIVACAYALRAEELLPLEAGPPLITSICFSIGPFGR
ncbi:hypothetical protein GW17_00015369, partial [Ensete ventricosum]